MTNTTSPLWADSVRAARFEQWLDAIAERQKIDPRKVDVASADASFRRYLRVRGLAGHPARIVMDAPPDKEDCRPFVRVAELMRDAGLHAPHVLEWDEASGFMLLTDLGHATMMSALDSTIPVNAQPLYVQALDVLLPWQQASRRGELPPYDEALLRRELQLFPDWYLARHRQVALTAEQQEVLGSAFDLIVRHNLAAPMVYVHRDFMPRNLMLPEQEGGGLGVLDFQDAVYGPVTYDIASLMRDAFISWDEEFVIDITVRYWERARRTGLLDHEGWHSDFASFYRACEWMGLQRHLKVAGIFARLTLRDGKEKYLADAPRFIRYIRDTARRYRELWPLLRLIDAVEGDTDAVSGYAIGRV
ncbi:MAG: phosphotransferase [Brachymonas sp.]|nr:phosphotransferase [Brachymonas sp.]MBP8820904.1 phosphotransferase [Brachymonas sp.]MBP9651499.1 phosphotransferase [Brachymonas sp.]